MLKGMRVNCNDCDGGGPLMMQLVEVFVESGVMGQPKKRNIRQVVPPT